MRSKPATYLLIALVLVVWSLITWKIVHVSRRPTATQATTIARRAVAAPPDSLLLDYPDPFLKRYDAGSRPHAPVQRLVRTLLATTAPTPPEPCPLKYVGVLRHAGKTDCILLHEGSHHTLARGEQLEGFILKVIREDSILLAKGSNTYTLHLEP